MQNFFTANDVGFNTKTFYGAYPDVLIVNFGRVEDDALKEYLMLQRVVEDDEEDDGYYVEWCDESNSDYECLELFETGRNQVRIRFKENVDFAKEIVIEFDISSKEFEALTQKLKNVIFRNSDCFSLAENY